MMTKKCKDELISSVKRFYDPSTSRKNILCKQKIFREPFRELFSADKKLAEWPWRLNFFSARFFICKASNANAEKVQGRTCLPVKYLYDPSTSRKNILRQQKIFRELHINTSLQHPDIGKGTIMLVIV
jgi:hypothetical protein